MSVRLGKVCGSNAERAALTARLLRQPDDARGLLPTHQVIRSWAIELAVEGDTVREDTIAAADDAQSCDGGGDDDCGLGISHTEWRLPHSMPGKRLHQDGVRTLLLRVCSYIEAELISTPELLSHVSRTIRMTADDAIAEVDVDGVTLRQFHDNALSCINEALRNLLAN